MTNNDDTGVVAVDANNNGSFADAGDQVASVGCCNQDTNVTLNLTAGQTIGIFYGLRDGGGESGLVGHFTLPSGTDTLVTPGDPAQAGLFSYQTVTGGGSVQVDTGAELRARTIAGATSATLAGTLTLSAGTTGSPLTSSITTLTAVGGLPVLNVGASHTLTVQNLAVPGGNFLPTALTKAGAGTLAVTGRATVTLNNSSIIASVGVTDMSSTVVTAAPKVTVPGLQGLLYVNAQTNPRVAPNGAGAAGVTALLGTVPTASAILTSANGPNGGLDFRNDNDFATFFNNTQVGNGGNSNFTVAFVGNYTARTTGTHIFGFEQNDDNAAIYVDLNRNGVFEDNEKVFDTGCCLQNPPNADFGSGTTSLTAGQTYSIAILNEETGGGSDLGAKFQDPSGSAPIVIAPDGTAQQPFTFSTGGGALEVDAGATLLVAGTSGPVDLTLNGTLTYTAQTSASASNLNNVSVAASQTGTLNVMANQNVTVTGALALTGNLVKTGAGRLAINVVGTGTGSVTVQGGVLGGSGSIAGPAMIASGGTIAPGNSVGTLGTGDFSITGTGGTVAIELDPTNSQGNGTTDNLNVTGAVTLTGGNLAVTLLSFPTAAGQQFQIITNDAADAVTGAFTTVNGSPVGTGNTFSIGGNKFSINYAGGTGNDVVITATAVPEPASLALLGVGTLGLLARRRRVVK